MKLGRTLLIGVLGTLLAVGIERLAGIIAGRDADLCLLVGAVLSGTVTTGAIALGCVAQLVVAVVSAYIYAFIFEFVTRRAGAVIGFLIGIGHVVIAGLVVGFMPGERLLAADVMPPGAFMEYRGAIVLAGFLLAHLVFGTFVGATYGTVLHSASPPSPRWRER
jgi:hypothetical protein